MREYNQVHSGPRWVKAGYLLPVPVCVLLLDVYVCHFRLSSQVSVVVTGNGVLRTVAGFNRIASVASLSITDNHNGQAGRNGVGVTGFGNLTLANAGVNISANGNIFIVSGFGAAATRSTSTSGPLTVDHNDGLRLIGANGFDNFATAESGTGLLAICFLL